MWSEHPATAAIALAATLGLGLVVVSCNKSPTQPSNPPGGPQGGSVVVTRLDISGPTSVEPGGSAAFTANAVKADGSVQNVTEQAEWTSSDGSVLQFTAPGVAAAVAAGEAVANARFESRSATARVMVLPAGTFRLSGTVANAGVPLEGVTVEVIEGTGQGLRSVTGGDGSYAIYGVAGGVKLHAKKEGFVNSTARVEVAEHKTFEIELRFDGEEGDLGGRYSLQLDLTGCTRFPDAARTRTYVAAVEHHGPNLSVRLAGADFLQFDGRGDHFFGVVDRKGRIFFALGDSYYDWYFGLSGTFNLAERLDPTSALVLAGTVEAARTDWGISGTLLGTAALTRGLVGPFTEFSEICFVDRQPFEMRRQ